MERGGSNFHCVKCKLAYMTFDQMYDHIKKYHVSELLSGLAKSPGPGTEPPERYDKGCGLQDNTTGPRRVTSERDDSGSLHRDVQMEDQYTDSAGAEEMQEIVARRKNYAEILRRHFYGESSHTVTQEQKSEGKACLEHLLTGDKPEENKTVENEQLVAQGQLTLIDLLTMPSTSTSVPSSVDKVTPERTGFVPPETRTKPPPTQMSKADEEKCVILHISQMEKLLTHDLMHLYEEETHTLAPRLIIPKVISPGSKIDEDALRIIPKGEDSEGAVPQVRTRSIAEEKAVEEDEMETEHSYSIKVSGIHPKYKTRKLDAFSTDKLRKQKVITLSSKIGGKSEDELSTRQREDRGLYIPKAKKEVEYDSEDECYYIVETDESESDPEKEQKDSVIREILDDKFGGVNATRHFDPYFEYLWKESFALKDRMYDSSDITDVIKSHAWSYPRL